jgi:ribulose-phosphate 3-epimerase
MNQVKISGSILSADFANLGRDIEKAIAAGIDWIHFDVMDNHFVPNLSFGAVVCESIRKAGIKIPMDVHLMVDKPETFIEPFAKAGANLIAFHPETTSNVGACLQQIKNHGLKTGLVLNPDRPLSLAQNYLENLDMLLIMSVYPGFAGQSFIPNTLKKIQQARDLLKAANSHAWLAVDGGVKEENINTLVAAGADFCVIGSGLFH